MAMGADWEGPTYEVSREARQKIAREKSSFDKSVPRLVELCKFNPKKGHLTQALPNGVTPSKVIAIVLKAQPDLAKKKRYGQKLEEILSSDLCVDILLDSFWFFLIEMMQPELRKTWGKILFDRVSTSFAKLIMAMTDKELKRKSVSSISTSQDNFLVRYSQLLAQMLYASYCHSFPQSQEKFQSSFREELLQTTTMWICRISVRPNLHEKWQLEKLEPAGWKKIRDEEDNEEDTVDDNPRKTKAIRKIGKLEKIGAEVEIKETPREYGFIRKKFNTQGLSCLLSQYLTETLHGKLEETKVRTTRRILPLVDRTEIDPSYPSGVPLRDILSDSRRKVSDIRAHMEFQYRDQNRQYRDRKIERAKYAAEMDAKIAKLMTSKKQIRTLTKICMLNTSARNPVPTNTILRLLNSNG